MTWQSRYPEIAKGIEQAAEKQKIRFSSNKVYKPRTHEEAVKEHADKLAKLKEECPGIYSGLPSSKLEEQDWVSIINPKSPFGD